MIALLLRDVGTKLSCLTVLSNRTSTQDHKDDKATAKLTPCLS